MVALKLLIFAAKLLAKVKPGAKVTFKLSTKGRTVGVAGLDPTGATLFYIALSSLNGFAVMLAVGFILKRLTNRGLVFVWDEGLSDAFPDIFNSTTETGANLVTGELGPQDIGTLAFKPTRERVVSDSLESALINELDRPLEPWEKVGVEIILFGFNFLPAAITVPITSAVVGVSVAQEEGELDTFDRGLSQQDVTAARFLQENIFSRAVMEVIP